MGFGVVWPQRGKWWLHLRLRLSIAEPPRVMREEIGSLN